MADEKDNDDPKDPVITPVGPGADAVDNDDADDIRDEEATETRAQAADDSDDEDERAGHSEDEGDDRDALRQRRRDERQRRRKRQHVELNFLRRRNEDLERRQSEHDARLTQTEVVTIEGRIAQVDEQIREAERIKAEAITKGDGNSAAEADRIREQLLGGKRQLEGARAQTVNGARQRQQQPTIDPQVKARVDDWITDNSDWFDPNLGNEDSAIARAIEDTLFRERRLDPRTDAYWSEYNRRLEKRLPHLFEDQDSESSRGRTEERSNGNGDDRPAKRNGGPRMTTGGRERTLRKNEVYISAERRKAMEEAGVWDDETLRNRYLKRYQQYDRENGVGRNRH